MKDFHLPLHSGSVFFKNWGGPRAQEKGGPKQAIFGHKKFRLLFFPALISTATKKATQTFFVQSFSTTLRVMDVRAENRGCPHKKVRFPAAPVVGRNFLTAGHPGVRVGNVRGKSGPKSLCLCVFFSSLNCGPQASRTTVCYAHKTPHLKWSRKLSLPRCFKRI